MEITAGGHVDSLSRRPTAKRWAWTTFSTPTHVLLSLRKTVVVPLCYMSIVLIPRKRKYTIEWSRSEKKISKWKSSPKRNEKGETSPEVTGLCPCLLLRSTDRTYYWVVWEFSSGMDGGGFKSVGQVIYMDMIFNECQFSSCLAWILALRDE